MTGIEVKTSEDSFLRGVSASEPGTRHPVEVRVSVDDPFSAYQRVRVDGAGFFYETTGGQSGWGYLGVHPEERITVHPNAESLTQGESPALATLAGWLEDEALHRGDCEVPYPCGLFGWISYDVARELEQLPQTTVDDRLLPQLQFGLFERVAAWKAPQSSDDPTELIITVCPNVVENPARAYEQARERATAFAKQLATGAPRSRAAPANGENATFRSDCGRSGYADRVKQIKSYIRDGDTFQVNISHRLRASATVDPVTVYAALRRVNPAPYSALIEFPGVDLVSASPELLLEIDGRHLATEPIAGTRPRGETTEADTLLESELVNDEKERAEHAMLVDLERNDLGKVSTFGSVEVTEYRRVDRYSEVMHLVSLVESTLRDDVSLAGVCRANPLVRADTSPADRLCAAIAAVFPGGTITGAPKPRTMEIIEELESTRRGPYTGSIAVIGFDQRATLNIIIRTLTRVDDEYHLRVGAGIVHDSVPDQEYDETMDKARALLNAVNEALDADAQLEIALNE